MVKILVIEDDALVRENIQEILELEDFATITAADGFLGLQLAKAEIPDLIICDVMMPRLDGYGLLAALRQNATTNSIPLIFLTAKADRSELRQGMELGADDYLTKPFTPSELLRAIAARLEKQTNVMQHYSQERHRVEKLQRKIQESQKIAHIKENLLKKLSQDLRDPVSNINMAIYLLKNSTSPAERDRYINILQNECAREIALLNEVSNLQELLSPEKAKVLYQFKLLSEDKQRKKGN
ncbi:MAG: response regulator [Kastovskya adunca ATA6-11-RM4]|jgi:DNA-binding response OmpR family regulator|nr:response regulator [Kastovskya adunca ATA6-11-RM4]